MKLAERISRITPSITLGLNARTLELKAQGRDIIAFGVGEPDINTPRAVCDAGKAAIDDCIVRYTATAGTPELREAICGYVEDVYGLSYETNCVMASAGGKQVLYNAILATAGRGDEFILPVPYWTSYPEFISLADAKAVMVETVAENQFKMTPEALEKAITPRSTAVLLNSPSNPTGVAYSRKDLEELAEVLKPHDIWILSDDIYCALLFDGHEFATMAQIPGFKDRTLIINGVSKTWSMTGWVCRRPQGADRGHDQNPGSLHLVPQRGWPEGRGRGAAPGALPHRRVGCLVGSAPRLDDLPPHRHSRCHRGDAPGRFLPVRRCLCLPGQSRRPGLHSGPVGGAAG